LTQSTVWMAWNSLSFSTGSFTYDSSSRLYISASAEAAVKDRLSTKRKADAMTCS
jgi:hypothetical protein